MNNFETEQKLRWILGLIARREVHDNFTFPAAYFL